VLFVKSPNVIGTSPPTVDGCEILHQFIGGKHPIIYRLSTIPGAGFRNHPQDEPGNQHSSSGWWYTYPPEKIKVNGKDDIPYMKWNIKSMFQTTNQMSWKI